MPEDQFLRSLPDDGLYLPSIKPHSLEKIRRHNYYTRVFASAMKNKWPQLAYVGLYSGAGRAQVEGTGEIVETTAMSVFRLPDPFTKYVFVDSDPFCTEALQRRVEALEGVRNVSILQGDAHQLAPAVRAAMPAYGPGNGLLSFCFVDPFAADLQFDTIRILSTYRMDFLILLMLGWDARVNFRRYRDDPSSTRIAELIDCPDWRKEYTQGRDTNVIRFLLRKFDQAMVKLGYLSATADQFHRVTAAGTNVLQYMLVFYTRHPIGQRFWKDTLVNASPQLGLSLE